MDSELQNGNVTERQLVTFLLGEDEFGADIMDVKEIIRVPAITKVPNAPTYVEGACNLRGNVLPIIDGRTRFHLIKKERDENNRVLVIDVNGVATGVIVDKVSEVMRVHNGDIEDAPQIVKNVETDYLNGVVKLNSGNRLIMLLDIVKALSFNEERGKSVTHESADINVGKHLVEHKSTADVADEEQLVSFLVGKEEYAINIMRVKEIIRVPQIVKIPNSEEYIDGVVSIRNSLLPIINLRTYLDLEQMDKNDQMRILVVDMDNFTAGILVDRILEVSRVSVDFIQPPPRLSMDGGEQLKGVAKPNNGKRMILILDPTKLIPMDVMSQLQHAQENGIENQKDVDMDQKLLEEEKLVTFRLGVEEYGIKIAYVQEINRMTEITKIPRAPHYIDGIVNLRGNVIPALNLRKLFSLETVNVTDSTRIIIIDINDKRTGIVVDSVSEVISFEKKYIEPTPDILSSGVDSDFVDGVGKLDGGKRMIMILNLEKIMNDN